MSTSQKASRVFQLVAGVSLNGKIVGKDGSFKPYSSPEDQSWLQQKIAESDVLLMGRKTFEKHVSQLKKPLIVFTRKVNWIRRSERNNPEVHWFNDSKQELLNLCDLLRYRKITILGGAEIYHWCIEQGLVTDLFLTLEPYVFNEGKHLLEGGLLQNPQKWKLSQKRQLNSNGSYLLHYQYA